MSVPQSKRSKSKTEFLRVSRDLQVYLMQLQERSNKKYRYFFSHTLVDISAKIYSLLKYANSIYATTNEDYYERIKLFKGSRQYLQSLISQVEVAAYAYDNMLSHNNVETLSEYMSSLDKLIKGVIESDKKQIKKEKEEVKKEN